MEKDEFYEIDVIRDTTYKQTFTLNPFLWTSFDGKVKDIISNISNWHEEKYFDDAGQINSNINNLPNNMGGIYMFVVKPDILPNDQYVMYIGKAEITEHQNLRKRCKAYYTQEYKQRRRPKISQVLHDFRDFIYIRYFPMEDNSTIAEVEGELIDRTLPPCNPYIPNKKIRFAVSTMAF